jgi:uncharacterized membrane protein
MNGWLLGGLFVFLAVHSIRIVDDPWRASMIRRVGLGAWKAGYSILSLIGFLALVYGYARARTEPTVIYVAPLWTRHLAALLTVPAFILLVAAYLPGTHLKARVGHPMVLAVKFWAFAHLLANGMLADLILFGTFLVWSIVLYVDSRRRDRQAGVQYPVIGWSRDALAVALGVFAWTLFAFVLHRWLFGVHPFA